MTNFILDYINIINVYNIYGTNSIQYVLFFISVFKTNVFSNIINIKDLVKSLVITKEESHYDILEMVRKKINSTFKSNVFDFEFDDNNEMLEKLVEFTVKLDDSKINIKQLIDECFVTYMNNENLSIVKEYVKNYNNKQLIKWISGYANIKQTDRILDANYKINSFYDEIKESNEQNNQKDSLKLYGLQSNCFYKSLFLLNNLLKYKETYEGDFSENDPLFNDIAMNGSSMYDIIFLDMPHGIHNVIHASCCQKIKKLKLRGTKAEPLLLQLVMSSLNKNGKGILIVPDSLLFSDSIQPVETREYLLNHFNVKKIIQIDESLYWGNKIIRDLKSQSSTIKNSIIIFENNGKTKSVEFSKISQKENQIVETKLVDIKSELFESNGYSLYYKNYLDLLEKSNEKITFMCVHELFDTITSLDNLDEQNLVGIGKNYKGPDSIALVNTNADKNICEQYSLFFKEKQLDQVIPYYCSYFLKYKLKLDSEKYTKGKMAQFDINKIKEIKIPIISKNKQTAVYSYLMVTNSIINENNKKIEYCNDMIKSIMEILPTDKMIMLESIVNLYQSNEINPTDANNTIGIVKNGLGAGTVYLPEGQLSNNSHYLVVKNANSFLRKYIYEYLKYSQDKIKANANLTPQPSLTKSFVLNFQISDIDIDSQEHLCSHCEVFNNTIERYNCSNTDIKDKNIINTVIKLNGFY
jgi:hypothetical protein